MSLKKSVGVCLIFLTVIIAMAMLIGCIEKEPSAAPYVREAEWWEIINFSSTLSEKNDTHGWINISYVDISNETSNLALYINNTDTDRTNVWNQTWVSSCNDTQVQVVVDKTGGKAFYVGFIVDHETFGRRDSRNE